MSHHHTPEYKGLRAVQAFDLLPVLMIGRHVPRSLVVTSERLIANETFEFPFQAVVVNLMSFKFRSCVEFITAFRAQHPAVVVSGFYVQTQKILVFVVLSTDFAEYHRGAFMVLIGMIQ